MSEPFEPLRFAPRPVSDEEYTLRSLAPVGGLPPSFRPPIVSPAFQAAFESVEKVLRERHAEALDKLTREQFITVMGEALASGDFMRHVLVGGEREGQMVTYEPYREQERLKARIRELEALIPKTNECCSEVK